MSQATPNLRDLAKRLIAHEARARKPASTTASNFQVCEKLRPHLAKFMGSGGYFALCSRALALASADVVWLRTISLEPGGTLTGGAEGEGKPAQNEVAAGEVALVAHLLGLLATFIGEDLMLRQLQEVWPDLDFDRGGRK